MWNTWDITCRCIWNIVYNSVFRLNNSLMYENFDSAKSNWKRVFFFLNKLLRIASKNISSHTRIFRLSLQYYIVSSYSKLNRNRLRHTFTKSHWQREKTYELSAFFFSQICVSPNFSKDPKLFLKERNMCTARDMKIFRFHKGVEKKMLVKWYKHFERVDAGIFSVFFLRLELSNIFDTFSLFGNIDYATCTISDLFQWIGEALAWSGGDIIFHFSFLQRTDVWLI